ERNDAGAAEQQDQREADDEGRRDDRQDGEEPQPLLEAEAGSGRDQRENEAEDGRAQGGDDREEEGAPGNAATPGVDDAVEAPDRRVDNVPQEAVRLERAVEVLERADEHADQRIEYENRDQQHQQADGADDEGVALERTALGHAEREDQREDDGQGDGAGAHRGLAR